MPHIILEFSDNLLDELDPTSLLADLTHALSEAGNYPLNAIKSRLKKYQDYYVADGKPENVFIHLQLAILAGRSLADKNKSLDALTPILKEYFSKTLEEKSVSLTLEVRELDAECYQKASVIE